VIVTGNTVLVEDRTDRVVATLNRPAARNAISAAMVDELHCVCELVESAPRPLILTGLEATFAAGADIAQLRERGREEALQGINRVLFDRIAALPQPTVAAVNGPALGGGAELCYACDVRLASETATFANPEPGLGIMAAAGASWRLSDLVGSSVAKQVLLAGLVLDARRARDVGLVLEVVDGASLMVCAHQLVDQMLKASPLALRLTKLAVDSGGGHPLVDDLAQAVLFETKEKHERMTKFLQRPSR
jgi:enoyl-CoA hydratase